MTIVQVRNQKIRVESGVVVEEALMKLLTGSKTVSYHMVLRGRPRPRFGASVLLDEVETDELLTESEGERGGNIILTIPKTTSFITSFAKSVANDDDEVVVVVVVDLLLLASSNS